MGLENRGSSLVVMALFIAPTTVISDGAYSAPVEPSIELALHEGARLEARTNTASITVIAGDKLKRRYEWDGCGLNADMSARKDRWFGSLGMYDPAGRSFIDPSAGCKGISRPVVEEGQIHFSDENLANAWITRYKKISPLSTVWTNDGLLIQWGITPQRHQINVDLWQICINGKRPVRLAGSLDQAIKASHQNGPEAARRQCAKVTDKVIIETQKIWSDHWRQADEWAGQFKQ